MGEFFASLFQRIFVLLNAQYSFDDSYQECIAESTERIRPFGNIPRQLASQIEQTFRATRTFSRALATGWDVLNDFFNKVPTSQHFHLSFLLDYLILVIVV